MQRITEITEGQEISTKVLNAWMLSYNSTNDQLTGALRIIKRVERFTFSIIGNKSSTTINLIFNSSNENFIDFYNNFYNLNVCKDFRSIKLQVTPAQSKLVQEKLFKLGYQWLGGKGKTEVDNTHSSYLYTNELMLLGWSNSEHYFNTSNKRLITVEDILGYTSVHISLDWPKSVNPCDEIPGPQRSAIFPKDFKVYSPDFETSLQILAKMQELGGQYWKHTKFNNHNEVWWSLEGSHISYTTIKSTFDQWDLHKLQYTELLNIKINEQEHEHNPIILPKKNPTITRSKGFIGTAVSGTRCKAAITSRYLRFRAISS